VMASKGRGGERYVCQFSCGAASAVATKWVLANRPDSEILIVNAFVQEEDADNRRFLADCEKWFGRPVLVLRDEKYGASTDEVWRRKRFICTAKAMRTRTASVVRRAVKPTGRTSARTSRIGSCRFRRFKRKSVRVQTSSHSEVVRAKVNACHSPSCRLDAET